MLEKLQHVAEFLDVLARQQPLITTLAALIAIWAAMYHAIRSTRRWFRQRRLAQKKNREGVAKVKPNTTPPASA